jgi:myo-inositol 2-dehydrogenase/D-chiro-inositol 1-dehydrogenase
MRNSRQHKESSRSVDRKAVLDRRQFVGGLAATAASFAIVRPSLVRGSQANSRIEVGCVGLGSRGTLIAGMLAKHTGFQVVSVADYFPEVAQKAGNDLNIGANWQFSGLSAYKKLLAGKVDAVFLETPPCFFPEHAAAAVDAGCHVYMAKPVAVDVPGCRRISELGKKATENRQVFLVDFQTRTDPFNIEAVRRCHAGLIGKVALLSSLYTDEAFADPPKTATIESRLQRLIWVNDIDLGGGMLVNAGIHAIDLALWIAGATPSSAMGSAATAKPEPHGDTCDVYSVTYQFNDGLILNHRGEHIRNTHGFACNCLAYGQYGYMETNYEGKAHIRGNKGGYGGGDVKNLYVDGISRNLDTFHGSIVGRVYENPTVESSVNSTLATILGREASRNKATVTWDQIIRDNRRIEANLTGLRD